MAAKKLFPTSITLPAAAREKMVPLLNQVLAELLDLWSQVKHAHWNVKGAQFHQLHLLFDTLAEELDGHADEVAERAVALGGTATGTARAVSAASKLPDFPAGTCECLAVVAVLVERYAAVGGSAREGIRTAADAGDEGTADLLTGLVRDLDKNLWFLEAHLQRG